MSTAIVVAIVALMSTIVGATIGAATNYALAVRRERADRERDSRNHAIEVKRAARLIDAELVRGHAAAQICVEKRHWWPADARLPTEAWQKYSSTIAPDLSDQAWRAVLIAVEALDNIRGARDLAVSLGGGVEPLSDASADGFAPMLRDIELGRVALAPLVFDSLPASGDNSVDRLRS